MIGVAVDADDGIFGKDSAVSAAQKRGEFWCQVYVDEAGNAEAAEQATAALRTPDNAGIDDRSSLDFFIGPNFDAGLDDSTLLDNGVVADDGAFKHHRFALDAGRRTNQGTTQFGTFANIGIVPDDAAVNLRTLINNGVVTNSAGTVNDGPGLDFAIVGKVERSVQLCIAGNFYAIFAPDAVADVLRGNFDIYTALQHVGVCSHILW